MKKYYLLLAAVLFVLNVKAQNGLNFDGVDDRVTIPNNAAYNVGTGNFTIEAWVKLSTSQNVTFPTIVSKRDWGAYNGLLLMIYQGKIFLQINGINLGQGATNVQDNICHHVAVTRTGTVINYYVDGNLDATFASAGDINTVHALWIGRDEPAPYTTPFKGLIHEFRYWNIARTQSQIQNSRNAFLVGNESGLIGYWRMNDGTGQTVNDFTALNNDGFLGTINTADGSDPVYQTACLCGANITAGGPISFCNTGSVLLTANSGTGLTYQWKKNGNNISGATSQTYTATTAGNYTCVVTTVCGNVTSNTITITVYTTVPAANITAGGPTTFCSNGSVILSCNYTGPGVTYQWQKNTVNISGATVVNYTAYQTGNYRCVVANACGSSNTNAILVTVNTLPTAVISPAGTINICTGASVLLTASPGAGYIYQWKKNGTNISGATAQTYTVSQAGGYTVVVTLGSCTATSGTVTVTVNQTLTPTITSQWGGYCGSTTVSLYTDWGSGYSYAWFEDTYPIPNSNAQQLDVGHNANYSVQINNGCGTFSSAPYTVTDFVSPYIEPYITIGNSGSLNLCAGGTVDLYISSNTFYSSPAYQWYQDGVAISGANYPNYTASTGGNYACSVYDYLWCGYYGPTVFSNWIAVTSTPSAAITPQGSTTFCNGGSVILSANAGGGYGYQWRNNNINISGATNQNYTVTVTGSYKVVVTNTCGSATSAAVAVTVNTLPSATITPAGPTTFCTGGSVVLNVPFGVNRTYQWLKGGVAISGATQSSYTASIGGTYKATVTNTVTGCSRTGTGVAVVVNSLPSAVITPQGPTTFCAGGNVVLSAPTGTGLTYKWKKNGAFIGGATLANYTATTAGTYKVQVTNSNGCSKTTANGIVVTVPCRESESLPESFDVKISPNPSSGDFIFEFQNENHDKISITVVDVIGKVILTEENYDQQFTIHSSQLTAGVYSAVIINGENKRVFKLVKTE